jgi:hypothetical protein
VADHNLLGTAGPHDALLRVLLGEGKKDLPGRRRRGFDLGGTSIIALPPRRRKEDYAPQRDERRTMENLDPAD